jgi:hypothetical protein
LWLGLENSVFALESPSRPALESLRRAYAQGVVALGRPGDDGQFFDLMAWAHYPVCWAGSPSWINTAEAAGRAGVFPGYDHRRDRARGRNVLPLVPDPTEERGKSASAIRLPDLFGQKRAARASRATANFFWASPTTPRTSTAARLWAGSTSSSTP